MTILLTVSVRADTVYHISLGQKAHVVYHRTFAVRKRKLDCRDKVNNVQATVTLLITWNSVLWSTVCEALTHTLVAGRER